jgi:hypothetical protein
MSALFLIVAIAFAASWIPLAFAIGRNYGRFRGARIVICPETITSEAVEVDAVHAAWTAAAGYRQFSLTSCSRWPERGGCPQQCLAQIEEAPDGCLVRARVARWYEDSTCAFCGKAIGPIHWFDRRPGLVSRDGEIRDWRDLAVEDLAEAFAACRPVCFDCSVAETFRARFRDLVVEDPRPPAGHEPDSLSGFVA